MDQIGPREVDQEGKMGGLTQNRVDLEERSRVAFSVREGLDI